MSDPHSVLGVAPEAGPGEVTRAFRRAARRLHPDLNRAPDAQARMAELNSAYELLRSGLWQRQRQRARRRRPAAGEWLDDATRRALGPELTGALTPGERVELVTPAATWSSPSTLLALTDQRLLWLLDDVPLHRVRSLRRRDVARAAWRRGRLRRAAATLEVRTAPGRRLAWSELRPATAERLYAALHA